MSMTWQNGRQLATIQKGTDTVSYLYDEQGLRASKSVGNYTEKYMRDDSGRIICLINTDTADSSRNHAFWFYYNPGSSSPDSIVFDGSRYTYRKNIQGDVIAILDLNGNTVAKYIYDSWGKCIAVTDGNGNDVSANLNHIANVNPFRYRGYYYDNETGFYLTGTRYYDPEIGRFINADNQISGVGSDIRGYNLFAYCFNNPVNMSDPTGNWPRWITATVAVVAAVVTVAAVATGNIAVASVAAKITIAAGATYIAQSAHYDTREAKNDVATLPQSPQEAKDSGWRGPDTTPKGPAADCHQYTAKDGPNKKYVSPDGHREVIYNSQNKIVLDARDIGTYNFCPSNELWYSNQSIGHLIHDIIPWVIFGNSDDDPGWVANEIIRLFE